MRYLRVEGPSQRTGECLWSPLAPLAYQPDNEDDDNEGDDDRDDDDDGLATWPVCTPLLSNTKAASASSASA